MRGYQMRGSKVPQLLVSPRILTGGPGKGAMRGTEGRFPHPAIPLGGNWISLQSPPPDPHFTTVSPSSTPIYYYSSEMGV